MNRRYQSYFECVCDLTNLIVRILLRGIVISELLSERLHPGLTLFFVLLEVILVQLILLSLAALSTRFSRRDSDFCWGNELIFKKKKLFPMLL